MEGVWLIARDRSWCSKTNDRLNRHAKEGSGHRNPRVEKRKKCDAPRRRADHGVACVRDRSRDAHPGFRHDWLRNAGKGRLTVMRALVALFFRISGHGSQKKNDDLPLRWHLEKLLSIRSRLADPPSFGPPLRFFLTSSPRVSPSLQ